MTRVLSSGRRAVMAAGTTGRDAGVIEIGRRPGTGGVAGLTIVAAQNMAAMFSCGCRTVMTTETGALYLVMIYPGNRDPTIGGVTVRTTVTAGYMPCIFTLCRDAVVACETATGNLGVINSRCRHPSRVEMTGLTNIGGLDMSGVFTRG